MKNGYQYAIDVLSADLSMKFVQHKELLSEFPARSGLIQKQMASLRAAITRLQVQEVESC